MQLDDLVERYSSQSDDQLTRIVVASYELSDAVLTAHPNMAQDAGFDLFDVSWARRYWKNVVAEISGINVSDELYAWAIGESISHVAELVMTQYHLPAGALPAAVAFAIILTRAASQSRAAGK
jgi:hypothetical protein